MPPNNSKCMLLQQKGVQRGLTFHIEPQDSLSAKFFSSAWLFYSSSGSRGSCRPREMPVRDSAAVLPCTQQSDLMGPRATHGAFQGCGGCFAPPTQWRGLKKHCGPFTETEIPITMQVMLSEGYNWLFVVSSWGFFVLCWWLTASPWLTTD